MTAIRFDNVSKAYDLQAGRRTVLSALKLVTGGNASKELFYALKDVSFEIKKGEAFGIIGRNGAGKSTILKIIAGITKATSGSVQVNGLVSSLIELGAGFHPDMTGRENVYMSASILGIPKKFIDSRFKEIVDFAELWDFIDVPVKKYSSGMYARLGFAVAISIEPEILIVDEILSVGDVFFQQKCFTKMRKIIGKGTTFIYVTHDMAAMQHLCDRALLLNNGIIEFSGDTIEVVSRYYGSSGEKLGAEKRFSKKTISTQISTEGNVTIDKVIKGKAFIDDISNDFDRIVSPNDLASIKKEIKSHDIAHTAKSTEGNRDLEIICASFQNEHGDYSYTVEMMNVVTVRLLVRANQFIPMANVGFTIFDRMNNIIFSAGIVQRSCGIKSMQEGEERVITFRIRLSIIPGEYTFALGCAEAVLTDLNIGVTHHRLFGLGPIVVFKKPDAVFPFHGIAWLPMEVSIAG